MQPQTPQARLSKTSQHSTSLDDRHWQLPSVIIRTRNAALGKSGLDTLITQRIFPLMPKMIRKSDLPQKTCTTCGKPFTWRKKWEKVWDQVKYCSDRCRSNKPT